MSTSPRLVLLVLLGASAVYGLGCGGDGGASPDAGNQQLGDGGSQLDNGQSLDDAGHEDGAIADDAGVLTAQQMCEAGCDTCVDGIFLGAPSCSSNDFGCSTCQGGTGSYTPNFLIGCEGSYQGCTTGCAQLPEVQQAQCMMQCNMFRQDCFMQGDTQCSSSCNACYMQRAMCLSMANP